MADMIVGGADVEAANGTYVENGTAQGKPIYHHESNQDDLIVFDSAASTTSEAGWVIYDQANFTFVYITYGTDGDVATPDLCPAWYNLFAETSSALTVTAAGGGDPSGTLRRTNMNAQMQSLTGGFN